MYRVPTTNMFEQTDNLLHAELKIKRVPNQEQEFISASPNSETKVSNFFSFKELFYMHMLDCST